MLKNKSNSIKASKKQTEKINFDYNGQLI